MYWNIRACIFTIHLLLNIFYTNNEYLSLHRNNKCKWLNNERITYGKNDNVVRKEKGKRQQRQVIRVEHSFDWKLEKSKEKRKRKNETPDEQCSRLSTRLSDSKFVHTIPGNRIERDGGEVRGRRMNWSNVPNNGGNIAEAAARRTPPKIQLEASDRIRAYRSNFQGSTGERVEPGRHAADHDWIKDTLRLRHASFRSRKPLATLAPWWLRLPPTPIIVLRKDFHSEALPACSFPPPLRDDGFTSEQFIRPGLCLT